MWKPVCLCEVQERFIITIFVTCERPKLHLSFPRWWTSDDIFSLTQTQQQAPWCVCCTHRRFSNSLYRCLYQRRQTPWLFPVLSRLCCLVQVPDLVLILKNPTVFCAIRWNSFLNGRTFSSRSAISLATFLFSKSLYVTSKLRVLH